MTQAISVSKLEAMILSIILLLVVGMLNQYANVNIKIEDITRLSNMLETEVNSTFYGLQQTPTYIVTNISTTACMQNGRTGALQYYSTNQSKVINFALGNLTSGRTWKEKVLLKGDFSIDPIIKMPNYAILELNGKIIQTANKNLTIIQNINWTNGNHDFEIVGGTWDWNRANQGATAGAIIWLKYCSNFTIRDAKLTGSNWAGILLTACKNGFVSNNEVYNDGDGDGDVSIGLSGTNSTVITHNRIENVQGGIYVGGENLADQRYGDHNVVSDNIIKNVRRDGVSLYPENSANCYNRYNVISNNAFFDCSLDLTHNAIKIGHHSGVSHTEYNDIVGNTIEVKVPTGGGTITICPNAKYNNVANNVIRLNNVTGYGIDIAEGALNNKVSGNMIYGANGDGIRCMGNNTLIEGNYIYDSYTRAIEIYLDTAGGGYNLIIDNYINTVRYDCAIKIRSASCVKNVVSLNYIINAVDTTEISDAGNWASNVKHNNYEDENGWVA